MQVGTIIGYPLTAAVISSWGWESVFYLQGIMTLVWCIFWWTIVTDRPEDFRWITKTEINYIRDSIGPSKQKDYVSFLMPKKS